MRIGVLKEIKDNENRVALTPHGAKVLTNNGNEVLVEKSAGLGSGFSDEEYQNSGAKIVDAKEAWDSDLIMKVKEPLAKEFNMIKPNSIIFTYLHLAGVERKLTEMLLEKNIISIGYETVRDDNGELPLLSPMSQVAGRMAPIIGSYYLAKPNGGRGILVPGVSGANPAKIVIIGAGTVGYNAAAMATSMGAEVIVMDIKDSKLRHVKKTIKGKVSTLKSSPSTVSKATKEADIVIGAVLVPGAVAPKVVTKDMVKNMKEGSVIVDVAIDQSGCIETSKPTSHSNPVFKKYGVIHYCVTNMPGAFPRTSTIALTNATLPYAVKIAKMGLKTALIEDKGLMEGVNTYKGSLTCKPVAEVHRIHFVPIHELIKKR